jgi:hypothetical protein
MTWFAKEIHIPELGLTIYPKVETTVIHSQSIFSCYNANVYYRRIVKENLKDCYKDLSSERKAINACITLYHLKDWYWKDDPQKKEKRKEVPYSLALANIANASKHFEPKRTYLSGKIEGTDIPETLPLNCGDEIIKIEDMLRKIEKYWDEKLK